MSLRAHARELFDSLAAWRAQRDAVLDPGGNTLNALRGDKVAPVIRNSRAADEGFFKRLPQFVARAPASRPQFAARAALPFATDGFDDRKKQPMDLTGRGKQAAMLAAASPERSANPGVNAFTASLEDLVLA